MVFVLFATFTLGTVLFKPIHDVVEAIAPATNYPGRTTQWEFLLGLIQKHPFSGYGLESRWGKPVVMDMERPHNADRDFGGIVHGHSCYLDAMLNLGIPGAYALFFVVIIQPVIDYLRANILAADFFMMIIAFTTLNAFMETFFFRRGNSVWMLMVLAGAGLRLTATTPLNRNSA